MRYYQSPYNSFRQNQPKKGGWFSRLFKRSPKQVTSQSSAPVSRYNNPYSRQKKQPSFVFPFKTVGGIIVILSWFGLMVYLPYFRITSVTYQGLRIIKEDEIKTIVNAYLEPTKFWPKNNYFIASEKTLSKELMEKFSLHGIIIEKKFPNSVTITVEEKISSIIYDTGSNYYLLDQSGNVLKQIIKPEQGSSSTLALATSTLAATTPTATRTFPTSTRDFPTSTPTHVPDIKFLAKEYADFPIVYDLRHPSLEGKQIVSKEFIGGLIEFYSAFKRAKLGTIKYGVVDEPKAGLAIITDKPYQLRVQPTHEIFEQIENLTIIGKQNKPKEYIDVRFNERVYWK